MNIVVTFVGPVIVFFIPPGAFRLQALRKPGS